MSSSETANLPTKTFKDLLKTIGCEDETIAALDTAGVKSIGDVYTFKSEDVANLCKIIRKDNKPFPFVAERNFKLMVSEAQIRRHTNRHPKYMYSIESSSLIGWHSRQQEKLSFKDPTESAPVASDLAKNWAKGFEQLEHWIGLHVDDATGMPLAFAVRVGKADASPYESSNYQSLSEEYEKRCRMVDRKGNELEWAGTVKAKVWNILYGIFKDHTAYQYMRPFKKSKDGPAAFFAARQHFLGANNVNNAATALEAEFDSLSYTGENRRWNFEKFVNKHVELYNTAQDLVPYGYSGIDSASRVRKVLNGIKTDTLDSVKNLIMSDQVLASDFDRSMNLFKDFLAQKKSLHQPGNNTANIAAASAPHGGNGRRFRNKPSRGSNGSTRNNKRKANVSAVDVQDRYYTEDEYSSLSPEQKKALHELRKRRSRRGGQNHSGASFSQVSTQQIMQAIAAAVNSQGNDSMSAQVNSNEDSTVVVSNRNNPALRQSTTAEQRK